MVSIPSIPIVHIVLEVLHHKSLTGYHQRHSLCQNSSSTMDVHSQLQIFTFFSTPLKEGFLKLVMHISINWVSPLFLVIQYHIRFALFIVLVRMTNLTQEFCTDILKQWCRSVVYQECSLGQLKLTNQVKVYQPIYLVMSLLISNR